MPERENSWLCHHILPDSWRLKATKIYVLLNFERWLFKWYVNIIVAPYSVSSIIDIGDTWIYTLNFYKLGSCKPHVATNSHRFFGWNGVPENKKKDLHTSDPPTWCLQCDTFIALGCLFDVECNHLSNKC